MQVGQAVMRIEEAQERIDDRGSLLAWLVLGAVHCHLCPDASSLDRKLLRQLLRLHQQVLHLLPGLHVCSRVLAGLTAAAVVRVMRLPLADIKSNGSNKHAVDAGQWLAQWL